MWKEYVRQTMGSATPEMFNFVTVAPPPGEKRLVVQATSKSTRAQFIGAIRKAKNGIKASPALTPAEKANKALVYRCA